MPKSSTGNPSRPSSQITFKNEDDVFAVHDESSSGTAAASSKTDKSSKSSIKGSKASLKGSKASLKGSKASLKESSSKNRSKEKKLEGGPITSTPKSSAHRDLNELDISEVQKPDAVETFKTPSKAGNYVPAPYMFRGPESSKVVKGIPAKCPPYHLQLDHTLAVIWAIFSNEEMTHPLGIVQLQWALSFLRGIYTTKGEHPKDVALCIQTIEDELIEQYAEMVDEVQFIKKPNQTTSKKTKDKKSKSSIKSEDTTASGEQIPEDDGCDDDTCENKESDDDNICDDDDEKADMVTKQVPFSINYAEMISRSPPDVEQLFPTTRISKLSSLASGTKKSTSGLDTSASRDNMVEFLKAWRREQVDKIQAELRRLKSIENFIGNAEKENFLPYLDEKQLDHLVAQKVAKDKKK